MVRRAPREESEEAVPGLAALQAQRRILQIKRERDNAVQAAVGEAHAQLEDLQARVTAYQHAQAASRAHRQAERVAQVVELVEQRAEMEQGMGGVAGSAYALMKELGALVAAAVEGRVRDAHRGYTL